MLFKIAFFHVFQKLLKPKSHIEKNLELSSKPFKKNEGSPILGAPMRVPKNEKCSLQPYIPYMCL